jgi:hypothetical protein
VEKELRQVLYGSNAPVNIPELAAVDLEWHFDEPTRVELMKLHSEIERWIIKSTGAPPHAVILEDRPTKNRASSSAAIPRIKATKFHDSFSPRLLERTGRLSREAAVGWNWRKRSRAKIIRSLPVSGEPSVAASFWVGFANSSDFGLRSEPPTHPELLDDARGAFHERWLVARSFTD